jgi:hypothetical protein
MSGQPNPWLAIQLNDLALIYLCLSSVNYVAMNSNGVIVQAGATACYED